MRVGIIQSAYIPWRGYFDFIDSVDLFVIYDDVLYSKGSWRNRNLIKTSEGQRWLTVPVHGKISMLIDQVQIAKEAKPWQDTHRCLLHEHLEPAPFFGAAMQIWEKGVCADDLTLSQLNVRLLKLICSYLGITTPIAMSRDFAVVGAKTERLIRLLEKVGATVYLSGPAAQGYLDESLFRQHGIGLEYKTYDYPPYPQLWGEFVGNVTVLDLIANTGPDARQHLKSTTPNRVVIP
ncbi:MAG: hypothetical protein D4R88_04870 [Methanosarcinales archaeon]|nr:MAG: hypothetical protein D4R88_04870 [Methanosarcinales archaeon]